MEASLDPIELLPGNPHRHPDYSGAGTPDDRALPFYRKRMAIEEGFRGASWGWSG